MNVLQDPELERLLAEFHAKSDGTTLGLGGT
jgi:hypothetical protein